MAGMGAVIACRTAKDWETNFDQAKESKKLVVVDFTASWCGPCRFITPVLADLAKKLENVIFLKVDVDELKPVAEKWNVEAMPTFVFIKSGKEVDRLVGAKKDQLVKKIETHRALAVTA